MLNPFVVYTNPANETKSAIVLLPPARPHLAADCLRFRTRDIQRLVRDLHRVLQQRQRIDKRERKRLRCRRLLSQCCLCWPFRGRGVWRIET